MVSDAASHTEHGPCLTQQQQHSRAGQGGRATTRGGGLHHGSLAVVGQEGGTGGEGEQAGAFFVSGQPRPPAPIPILHLLRFQ